MQRYRAAGEVIFKMVGEEMVLLDFDRGIYYGLDPVGARIWELLQEERTAAELAERVVAEFEVDVATAAADVERLLAELTERKLILAGAHTP